MQWFGWVTFGLALVGAGLGVFNTVVGYWRGSVRWQIEGEMRASEQGTLELWIELVNTGRITVSVEQVSLLVGRGPQAKSIALRNNDGYPRFPCKLFGGEKITVGPVGSHALQQIGVLDPVAVMAKSQDGRVVEHRGAFLRQLHAQLKTAKV